MEPSSRMPPCNDYFLIMFTVYFYNVRKKSELFFDISNFYRYLLAKNNIINKEERKNSSFTFLQRLGI